MGWRLSRVCLIYLGFAYASHVMQSQAKWIIHVCSFDWEACPFATGVHLCLLFFDGGQGKPTSNVYVHELLLAGDACQRHVPFAPVACSLVVLSILLFWSLSVLLSSLCYLYP